MKYFTPLTDGSSCRRGRRGQFGEQKVGLTYIRDVYSVVEPGIYRMQYVVRGGTPPSHRPEARKAGRSAQLEQSGRLIACYIDGVTKLLLSLSAVGMRRCKKKFALLPMQLGIQPTGSSGARELQYLVEHTNRLIALPRQCKDVCQQISPDFGSEPRAHGARGGDTLQQQCLSLVDVTLLCDHPA